LKRRGHCARRSRAYDRRVLCGHTNGQKIRLFLEEAEIPHRLIPVSLSKGEQFAADFLRISPNNKIPAIVDTNPVGGGDPLSVFESGAILLYLAEKTGRFMPSDARSRMNALQWLFWQVGGLGPMAGQLGYFMVYAAEPNPLAIERYSREVARLYGVLDRALSAQEFLADDYSIADMACYPWIIPYAGHGIAIEDYPHLNRWFHGIQTRPATLKAYEGVLNAYSLNRAALSMDQHRVLFGAPSKTT
jgi:GSH-dependent disulfide-bond oxidoreductase